MSKAIYISNECKNDKHESDFTSENRCTDKLCKCNCHRKSEPMMTIDELEQRYLDSHYYDEGHYHD